MNRTVHRFWETSLDDMSDGLAFAPQCELILWLQPKPHRYEGLDSSQTSVFLHDVEKELKSPQGAPIGLPPLLSFSAVVFSPTVATSWKPAPCSVPKLKHTGPSHKDWSSPS